MKKQALALALAAPLASLAACTNMPTDGKDDQAQPAAPQGQNDMIIRPTGMYVTAWPTTGFAWPSGAVSTFVILHNGYAAGDYCVDEEIPCGSPAYTHAITVGVNSDGVAAVSAVYQIDSTILDRFLNQANSVYASTSGDYTDYLNWNIQGSVNGPPLPPHGPGGNQGYDYVLSDLATIDTNVVNQLSLQTTLSSTQFDAGAE